MCQVSQTLTSTVTTSHGKPVAVDASARTRRMVIVGSAATTIAAGKTVAAVVPLNASGRRLLRRFHKLAVTLTVNLVRAGQRVTIIQRALTIKPKRKLRKSRDVAPRPFEAFVLRAAVIWML